MKNISTRLDRLERATGEGDSIQVLQADGKGGYIDALTLQPVTIPDDDNSYTVSVGFDVTKL